MNPHLGNSCRRPCLSKTDLQGHVSKRPNILNASFCDQEEEFQKTSSIENKWLGFDMGFHVDAII